MKQSIKNIFYKAKFWYLLPLSVICFFLKEWREGKLYLSSLSVREKQEIKKRKLCYYISFSVSGILHVIFFVVVFNGIVSNILIDKNVVLVNDTVDFELMDGMVSSYLSPIYDEKSDIIIEPSLLIGERQKNDKKALSLDNLLNYLKASKNPILSSSSSTNKQKYSVRFKQEERSFKAGLGIRHVKKKIEEAILPIRSQLWEHLHISKPEKMNVKVNYADIMKAIDQHTFQFRDCYEQALLKDEKLSINAMFLLKINQSKVQKTRLELKGKGNPKSRRTLSHCLFKESKKLVFLKNKKNISVKFNLIFDLL